jgi:membrane-bound lytic murein transglycosylase MltF
MIFQSERHTGIVYIFTLIFYISQGAYANGKPSSVRELPLGNGLQLPLDLSDPIANDKRIIRVLVSYNDTDYFVANGKQRGLEYDLMNTFDKFLNKGPEAVEKHRVVAFISVPFEQLIPSLLNGRGDIAAAGLTVTQERKKLVAFSNPYREKIKEIVVKSMSAPSLTSTEELSAKQVHVLSGSSYATHLRSLNKSLISKAMPAVDIIEVDPNLEAEDILQMVNAGIYEYTVVDDHIAQLWAQMLKKIQPQTHVVVNEGGEIAWAVRKNNMALLTKLNEFVDKHKQGTLLGNILFKRYYNDTRWIDNPLSQESRRKTIRYMPLFQKYGKVYDIDWKLLAALAFQESGMNPKKQSPAGAVGIMQIKPSTATGKNVSIKNVDNNVENNIHAGAKYLDFLHQRYFSDPAIAHHAQLEFTLAAYNAGPARVRALRNKAKKSGLDHNKWFFNVEHIARKEIGRETVSYVANIYKYYIAFSSAEATLSKRAKVGTLGMLPK